MADIAMCNGKGCHIREECYRHIAKPDPKFQDQVAEAFKKCKSGLIYCENFWPIQGHAGGDRVMVIPREKQIDDARALATVPEDASKSIKKQRPDVAKWAKELAGDCRKRARKLEGE